MTNNDNLLTVSEEHLPNIWTRASTSFRTIRRQTKNFLVGQTRGWSNPHSNTKHYPITNQLYHAISAENWDLVVELCESKPSKAELWHTVPSFFDAVYPSTLLPLHMACSLTAPKTALLSLLEAYPPAAMAKESYYNRLPLHIACRSLVTVEQIRVLAVRCPSSCFEQDILGRIPLHYVLNNCPDIELVRELLIAASETAGPASLVSLASAADFKGWLPIHVACRSLVSADVLRLLVQIWPEGAKRQTKGGTTPLILIEKMNMMESRRQLIKDILEGTEENPPAFDELKRDPDEPVETFETLRSV